MNHIDLIEIQLDRVHREQKLVQLYLHRSNRQKKMSYADFLDCSDKCNISRAEQNETFSIDKNPPKKIGRL